MQYRSLESLEPYDDVEELVKAISDRDKHIEKLNNDYENAVYVLSETQQLMKKHLWQRWRQRAQTAAGIERKFRNYAEMFGESDSGILSMILMTITEQVRKWEVVKNKCLNYSKKFYYDGIDKQ